MTMEEALAVIREKAPETEKTFLAICANRYCHPVRDWAIYDIAKADGILLDSARRRYSRHLERLQQIFVSAQEAIYGKGEKS